MSGKEKPGVTRRLNRGRNAPDSKCKTDSGCFVDEEVERNGSTSSDSSQGSISSSPVTELDSKKTKVKKERKNNNVTSLAPSPELPVENVPKSTSVCTQDVMSEVRIIDDQNESTNVHSEDIACNIEEKTHRASDFYCLYYSASPESTLTRCGVQKVKNKPVVPPKPKLRRGSAPPSSFEKLERIRLQNEDITRRFSYHECQNTSAKPSVVDSVQDCDKRKSVEERVLFFESFAKDGFTESNDLLKNIQAKSIRSLSEIHGAHGTEVNVKVQNGSDSFDNDQNHIGNVSLVADSEKFSIENDSGCKPDSDDCDIQEQIAPVVEEEEFTVDGSIFLQSSINCDTLNDNYQESKIERDCLDCVDEIDEVDGTDHIVVDEHLERLNISLDQTEKIYSDQQVPLKLDVYTNGVVSEVQNGFKSVDASETREGGLVGHSKSPCEDVNQVSVCRNSTMPYPETTCGIDFKETLVNPRLSEIKQLSLPCFRRRDRNIRRRPGSITGIPNVEKGWTSKEKRRSWSFSESQPLENNHYSPLVHKVNQTPTPSLTTSSWQSENGLPLLCGSSFQQNRPVQSSINFRNDSQETLGWNSHSRTGRFYLEQSGYTSDDSSVHSEPLFQPLRRRPQKLTGCHIFKSVSCDSSISEIDNGMSSFSENQHKRYRHSLGSRDPVFALRRQSLEFSKDPLPVQQIQAQRLQTLRRTPSNASSSSDSEVERIFSNETSAPRYQRSAKSSMFNGLANAKTNCKVSAMEALFGPQSSSPSNVTLSTGLEQKQPNVSGQFPAISPQPLAEDFLPEEIEKETVYFTEPKEFEEPRLEFDDTDYSEFYTRCEDKDSIISAEALNIKKLLESPQTVLPDSDIESVVNSVTERKTFTPSSDDRHNVRCQKVLYNRDMDAGQANSELNSSRQFSRWNRGTQTPPAEVFHRYSPSVGTQTPPLSVSLELLPPLLLEELQRDLQTPGPPKARAVSPTRSSLESVRENSCTTAPFCDATRTSFQDSDKPVSVEELIQILATMKVGSTEELPTRRPISIQRHNFSPTSNVKGRTNTNSLPSSWNQLSSSVGRWNGNEDFKCPEAIPPRSCKSYDCLRKGNSRKAKLRGGAQAVGARGSESNEDIRKKLKEWTFTCKSQLFEEEVECLEEKRKLMKDNEKKTLKVSYDGSESTNNIETLSRLTKTHSLKRPRKDRAFSQRVESGLEDNSLDEKWHFLLPTPQVEPNKEKNKDGSKLEDPLISSTTQENNSDVSSDSLDAEERSNVGNELQLHEVGSPEGVDIFIDYRKKNGMHITSTPKPPPYPGNSLVYEENGVGKNNNTLHNTDLSHNEKPVSVKGAEDVPTDVESQGDASSSSYSSDDDRFGEFGGSTDTVVFIDTGVSTGISVVPDLDTMELKLVGSDNLLSVDSDDGDDDEKDEASLDLLLGEVRRSLSLEFVDSNILDKAIERFKQRVSPSSQNKELSGGLSMEAYVALHQADELQGIISEIKGELTLLHKENDMLREQVVTLANQQTNGEVSENSSTESSERLENLYKLYRPKHVNSYDEGDAIEVAVCLRGFSMVMLGHLPSKKEDIHLGTVTVKGADWNGVMEAARRIFVDHVKRIDPEGYLCLGAHSIQGVQTGVMLWSPDSLRKSSPRVQLSKKSNPCVIQLKDGSHFSCDSLVYDTLLPKETIEKYVEELLEHRHVVLCGQQSLGKSYLAARLAEHIVQRVGWKGSPAVVTFDVSQSTRTELKQSLASFIQNDISSPKDGSPAVIVLDQLNCLATLADIFDLSVLERNKSCPYIIGVRDKSRKGPFSSKELNLCHYFRWLRVSVNDRQYSGLLGRFLRRKLSWAQIQTNVEGSGSDLLDLFEWLSKVWYHLNEILEEYCEPDSAIGPSLFFSCPMDYKAAEGWFVNVWNYSVIPYLHQALRSGRKIFDRSISWEDPTKWVILRYPWNKDRSRVLHTLRKLRQVDVVLNRNHLGSDNVCFAECIEENEKILRAHSTVSKRVRTVVQRKVPKGELSTRRTIAEQRRLLGNEEDKISCYSESDSYLESSI